MNERQRIKQSSNKNSPPFVRIQEKWRGKGQLSSDLHAKKGENCLQVALFRFENWNSQQREEKEEEHEEKRRGAFLFCFVLFCCLFIGWEWLSRNNDFLRR